jgi:phosphatidate cytidylyltransferase
VSELAKRVASALVGAPIAIACIWFGDAALATLLAIAAATGAWEFYRMASAVGGAPFARIGIVLSAAVPLVAHAHVLRLGTPSLTAGVMIVLAVLALAAWRRGVTGHPLLAVATTMLGVLYVGVPVSYAYALRYFDWAVGRGAGAALLLLPVLCTWASDIGAYAAGRLIGGRKLMPSVSPGKTLAGAGGGLIASAALAAAYVPWVLRPVAQLGFAPGRALLFGVVISVAAQVGDLVESLLKRDAKVKDSSNLIPGHGGVLDRIDSLLFVLPVSYLLLRQLLLPAFGR